MALDIPAVYPSPPPDPARFYIGESIRSDDPLGVGAGWQNLGDALRYAHAVVGAGQICSEGWRNEMCHQVPPVGGGASAFLQRCRWRAPRWLSGKREARIVLWAKVTGSLEGGTVRLVETGTGVNLDFAIGVGPSARYVSGVDTAQHLEIDTALEQIEIWLQLQAIGPEGGGQVVVERISIEWIPLSGALDPGLLDGMIPVDTDELDPDEPLSADLMHSIRDSLDAMLARQRSFWSWSALEGYSTAFQPGRLALYLRRVWCPLNRGALARNLRPVVHAYCESAAGGDTSAQVVYAPRRSVAWTVPAGEPTRWYETGGDVPDELVWLESEALSGVGASVGLLEVRPQELAALGSSSDARILSLSIWGV